MIVHLSSYLTQQKRIKLKSIVFHHYTVISFKKKLDYLFSLILKSLIILSFVSTPTQVYANHSKDKFVLELQQKISTSFASKFCTSINSDLSKDEAMRSAIISTENKIAFTFNQRIKEIEKDDIADLLSTIVIDRCGWNFGLSGEDGIKYFKEYFLEMYKKTTPSKTLFN